MIAKMRAFLCGGGSGKQMKEAYQKFSEVIDKSKPLLYVPIAMNLEKYDECYSWIKKELGEYGIENIEMVKSYMELENIDFCDYCAIFFRRRKYI
ncbi:MAG: hypothetical protein IJH12_04480 [Clostridia bacterium]|nr:hypothetical protein [Clostridia bacterium]